MESKGPLEIESVNPGKLTPGEIERLLFVGMIEAVMDEEKLRAAVALADHALRVTQGRGRGADDRRGAAQAGDDPALQIFPGRGSRRIGRFPERTADREKIVTTHDYGPTGDVSAIHGVGMIADVNEVDCRRKFSFQLAGEKEKFVEITEPLCDQRTGESKPTEKWSRLDQLGRHARRGQPAEHHHREPLHALLLIGRVITDQKDHGRDESD